MRSMFMGIIASLSLVMWELHNAPIGYESEQGFCFGVRNGTEF